MKISKVIKTVNIVITSVLSFLVIFIGFIAFHVTTGVVQIEAGILLLICAPLGLLSYVVGRFEAKSGQAPSAAHVQRCLSCGKYAEATADSAFCSLCGASRAVAV
jgi:hypothetical protein